MPIPLHAPRTRTKRAAGAAALALAALLAACADVTAPTRHAAARAVTPAATPRMARPPGTLPGTVIEEVLPFRAGGYRYSIGAAGHTPGFQATAFDDSAWPTGSAAFGDDYGLCGLAPTIATPWPLGTAAQPRDLLVRRVFSIGAQPVRMFVQVKVDNDVQVWVNGVEVSPPGLVTHEGCAHEELLPAWEVPTSLLLPSNRNVVAVRARDRGAVSYLDVHVWSEVPRDTTPPGIAPQVLGTLGGNGWYTSDVTLHWVVRDIEYPWVPVDSVVGCGSHTVTQDTPGVTFLCRAVGEGGAHQTSWTIKRDATPPAMSVSGNRGTYTVADSLVIVCTPTDATSGVDLVTTTCGRYHVGEGRLTPGTVTYEVMARDHAGNEARQTVTYQVEATEAALGELVDRWVDGGLRRTLNAKLDAAAAAAARGNATAQARQLDAFIQQVNVRRRVIGEFEAARLIYYAGLLRPA